MQKVAYTWHGITHYHIMYLAWENVWILIFNKIIYTPLVYTNENVKPVQNFLRKFTFSAIIANNNFTFIFINILLLRADSPY